MKKYVLILAMLASIALSGCSNNVGSQSDIREARLEDGTRCAYILQSYKAALTCDWSGSK